MLNIINNLKPFFEDCYRRVNVREYSRIMKISPPTASKILFKLNKEGLLIIEKDRNYIFYYANKNDGIFIELSRVYWRIKLSTLIDFLDKNIINPTIILFGSLSKAETRENSDIDLCIVGDKKELNIKNFEDRLNRKIQLFSFNSISKIKNKELANNIINGCVLKGRLKL
jgi:predicted nucleotidyltransferase